MNLLQSLNKYLYISSFIVLSNGLLAQNLQDYKKAYPDFNEVILNDMQSYNFTIEDKKLKIIQDNHFESMILSEHGILNNEESFSYSSLVQLKSYDAYSVLNNSGKEKKIKVTQSNEKQARQSSVFYNDVKERQLIFPNLEAGAKKVYNFQTEFIDPYLLHKFIFGHSLPIKKSTLEIVVGKDINIGYKIFNDPTNAIAFSQTERKGKAVYTWTLQDIKPVKFEDNSPGYLHIVPHIDVYIKDYKVNDKSIDVLDDVDLLYGYYKGFLKNLNKNDDAALKQIALDITAGETTEEAKVKKIFYWVKDNVKYIAFENGYEGFIPREASLVYERKFGDCKDMASIITSMANYAGIKNVAMSWIGTREIPYSYAQLSTPAVDNHMIAVYKNGDDYVFLDATDNGTRYGLPTAFIQGKEALITENDSYKIVKVPIVPAAQNETIEHVKLSINNDRVIGSGTVAFNGFSRSHLLAQIGDAANKTRFDIIKSLVLKGNNKFNLTEYTEENVDDRDKPYVVNFKFELENYIVKVDKEIYINLHMDKVFERLTIEQDRVSKFEFDYLTQYGSRYELQIPENCSIKYIPKNVGIDNDLLKADFIYKKAGATVELTMKITLKKLMLETTDFELWNATVRQLRTAYNETLILTEK